MTDRILVLQEPEHIDSVAARQYGVEHADAGLTAIYQANPRLSALGVTLPTGTRIVVPELPERAQPQIKLWD